MMKNIDIDESDKMIIKDNIKHSTLHKSISLYNEGFLC